MRRTVKKLVLKQCSFEEDIEKLVPKLGSCEVDREILVSKPGSFEDGEKPGSKTMLFGRRY